jgi:integrase
VKEFKKSTGTADLKRARPIAAQLIAEQRAAWERMAAKADMPDAAVGGVLTSSLIKHVCSHRLYQWMQLDDQVRFDGEGFDEHTLEKMQQICQVTDHSMRSVLSRGKASIEWSDTLDLVDHWCEQLGHKFDRTDPLYPQLVRDFARVELEALGRVEKRNHGDIAETPPAVAANVARLSAMTETYRHHKQVASGSKHTSTTTGIWLKLITFCGDVPLNDITSHDLYRFIDAQQQGEHKPWSMKYSRGVVKRTLFEVFALARTRQMMSGTNPVDDLTVMPPLSKEAEASRMKPRYPYSNAQLNTLFASPWFNASSNRWTGKMGRDLGARYWVPLICMFHGNRIREVLQLVASDVRDAAGIPVMELREEMDGEQAAMHVAGVRRSLKNAPTNRIVPVHPALIELGFVKFVAAQRAADGDNAMLFPSSLPKPGGKCPMIGRAYEQAFLRFVVKELGFGNGFGNHSFRHQLEDRIRDAQTLGNRWPAGLAQAFTGRKRLRTADVGIIEVEGSEAAYGRGHGPAALLEYIKTLRFDAVTLPPPFEAWLRSSRA